MKIAFDAKRLFHNYTGLGNYSRTLVRNLVEQFPEHDYHLFSPTVVENDETAYFLNKGRFTIHTAKRKPRFLWRTKGIASIVEDLKIDIYHGLSHEIPLKPARSHTKYVVTFHDLIYEIYPNQFPMVDQWMYKMKYRRSAKQADHVVAISSSTKADLQSMYTIPDKDISVVFQSCAPQFLNEQKEHSTSRSGLLYVGSIIERKGLLQVAQAIVLLPEDQRPVVTVIGSGSKYESKVKDFIDANNISSHFDFKGSVANQALMQYYQSAEALVLPSVYEGFGIPVIEALSQGTPVITSVVSSLPEAAGPGGILVDPNEPEEIAQAMRFVAENPRAVAEMGALGKQYVNQKFNAASTAKTLMNVYKSLCDLHT